MPAGGSELPPGAVRIGRLGRTHGLQGSLRLHLDGAVAGASLHLTDLSHLHVAGHGRLRLRSLQPHGRTVLVAFHGVRSPERAQQLVNAAVFADGADLPEDVVGGLGAAGLEDAEVFVDGRAFGRVVAVSRGAQTLLLVRGEAGEHWVPTAAPYVTTAPGRVDLVDPPPGLLDDDALVDAPGGADADASEA